MQEVETNKELYEDLGDLVGRLVATIAANQIKSAGPRLLNPEMKENLGNLMACASCALRCETELISSLSRSVLEDVAQKIKEHINRDAKEYTGRFAEERASVRSTVRGLRYLSRDKKEVALLKSKVQNSIQQFKVNPCMLMTLPHPEVLQLVATLDQLHELAGLSIVTQEINSKLGLHIDDTDKGKRS